jgi:serine protease
MILVVVSTLLPAVGFASSSRAKDSDPLLAEQWGLHRIKATQAWVRSTGKRVTVAVVDTGIDLNHPDFSKRQIKKGFNALAPSTPPSDDNGHGTHVSGIIMARANNGIGIAGVAPSAKLVPVKVCNEGGFCKDTDIARGIEYAVDAKVDVINISIGLGLLTSKTEEGAREIRAAIERAEASGIVVIAGAGNYSLPICQDPGAYVLCVGATDRDDNRSFFSNGDATLTGKFLVAPGGNAGRILGPFGSCDGEIISTYPRELKPFTCGEGAGYARLSGTSQAAPHVAGVAALLFAQNLEADEVVDKILTTADDLGAPGRDPIYGYGRVNAARAVGAVD